LGKEIRVTIDKRGKSEMKNRIITLIILTAILFLLFSAVVMSVYQILLADQQILDFINKEKS